MDLKDEIGIILTGHSSTTIDPALLRHLDLVSALDKLARPSMSIGRLIFPPSSTRQWVPERQDGRGRKRECRCRSRRATRQGHKGKVAQNHCVVAGSTIESPHVTI